MARDRFEYHETRASCPGLRRKAVRFGRRVPPVDLSGRLSNPDIRNVVAHVTTLISHVPVDHGSTSTPRQAGRRLRLVDRLGEQVFRELLRDSGIGTTQRRLAEQYGISLSSVKRLTRRPLIPDRARPEFPARHRVVIENQPQGDRLVAQMRDLTATVERRGQDVSVFVDLRGIGSTLPARLVMVSRGCRGGRSGVFSSGVRPPARFPLGVRRPLGVIGTSRRSDWSVAGR
jgi:hypothetical protein